MRSTVADLAPALSLVEGIPAVYHDDGFFMRLVSVFDTLMAPAQASLDNLHAYCDPSLTPEDFLPWLGLWVGVAVDERWPVRRRRELIRAAPELYRWRGTARGVSSAVALYSGVEPELVENGATAYSPTPNGDVPGTVELELLVRVRTRDRTIDPNTVDTIVADAKPIHVPHRVEVVMIDS